MATPTLPLFKLLAALALRATLDGGDMSLPKTHSPDDSAMREISEANEAAQPIIPPPLLRNPLIS